MDNPAVVTDVTPADKVGVMALSFVYDLLALASFRHFFATALELSGPSVLEELALTTSLDLKPRGR